MASFNSFSETLHSFLQKKQSMVWHVVSSFSSIPCALCMAGSLKCAWNLVSNFRTFYSYTLHFCLLLLFVGLGEDGIGRVVESIVYWFLCHIVSGSISLILLNMQWLWMVNDSTPKNLYWKLLEMEVIVM